MEDFDRLSALISLIKEAGGEIQGRKKLQKLVYLLQVNNVQEFQYNFDFYNYGVFSNLLAHDLMSVVAFKYVNESPPDESTHPYYEITLNAQKNFPGKLNGLKLKQEDKELFKKSSAFLEVLSTILYLDKNGYKGSDLKRKLKELKGHLQKEFKPAYEYAEEHYNIKI